jgi:hypothetical protein
VANAVSTHAPRERRGRTTSLRAQFWIMAAAFLLVVGFVSVTVLWSLSTVVAAFGHSVETASSEAVPLSQLEVDMREAQAEGWAVGMKIHGGSTHEIRADFDATAAEVLEDIAAMQGLVAEHSASQAAALDEAAGAWQAALETFDRATVADHGSAYHMAELLQGFSEEVDHAVAHVRIARDAAAEELTDGLVAARRTSQIAGRSSWQRYSPAPRRSASWPSSSSPASSTESTG